MARRKKTYDDDDGRTIADMSDVGRQPLLLPRAPRPTPSRQDDGEGEEERPWEDGEERFSREERRWYILGALKAALLIALAFIVGIGIVIALMVLAWG